MTNFTSGSIVRHILVVAASIAVSQVAWTLYLLVDLHFVAELGGPAIAGVGAAGNAAAILFAITQVLEIGTVSLISQAVGRKDRAEINRIFNQSITLSVACGVLVMVAGYSMASLFMQTLSADTATVAAGTAYLRWFMPGLVLQFGMIGMGSALRGAGVVRPMMIVQLVSVATNIVLAPILIAGWGTGHPMGAAGAGLASSLSIAVAMFLQWLYFRRLELHVAFDREQARPHVADCKRILLIGLPAGCEMMLTFVYLSMTYWAVRDFGPDAQAGFGIGSRIMQAISLPALAIAVSVGAIAGQNFGAGHGDRVRQTFGNAAILGMGLMAILTMIMQLQSDLLVRAFIGDANVEAVAVVFLRIVSWSYIAGTLVLTCSSLFQGLGNTRPSLVSSSTRLITFALPAIWLSGQAGFRIEHLWYLSVTTVSLQAAVSAWLLWKEFKLQLTPERMHEYTLRRIRCEAQGAYEHH
jgi:putative MATE family efflux protein